MKFKLGRISENSLNVNRQDQVIRIDKSQDDCGNKKCASTKVLQSQKSQTIEPPVHLKQNCNVLTVFSFKSGKCDLTLIQSYCYPFSLTNEILKILSKKTNQFMLFKFGDIHFWDLLNFLGRATSLDSCLKAYITSETKRFFAYEWFDHPERQMKTEFSPNDAFYSYLCSRKPFDTNNTDYVNFLKIEFTTEHGVINLKLSKPPPTGIENYQYLQQLWKQKQLSSFKVFFRWYIKKDIVPALEAMY